MTKERLDELIKHELHIYRVNNLEWKWKEEEDRWEIEIQRMRIKELEEFLVRETNRYLFTLDTIKGNKPRSIGPQIFKYKCYVSRGEVSVGSYDSDGLPKVNSENVHIYVTMNNGADFHCDLYRLLEVDDYIETMVSKFQKEHVEKIEDLVDKIGKEDLKFQERMDSLKDHGII